MYPLDIVIQAIIVKIELYKILGRKAPYNIVDFDTGYVNQLELKRILKERHKVDVSFFRGGISVNEVDCVE